MLIPAFFLILPWWWVLDHVFLEEVDDKEKLVVRGPQPAPRLHLPAPL